MMWNLGDACRASGPVEEEEPLQASRGFHEGFAPGILECEILYVLLLSPAMQRVHPDLSLSIDNKEKSLIWKDAAMLEVSSRSRT
jgi:hypothetical protein